MPRSANEVNALIHLYRAEMGRLTSYRTRLDTTTSWAITSTALVTTFALGNHEIPHLAFRFLMFINFFFLQLEARRFRAYEASRYRVQFLESTFYPEMLGGTAPPDWPAQLLPALRGGPEPEGALYWEHTGNAAIRSGRWKLVRDWPRPGSFTT